MHGSHLPTGKLPRCAGGEPGSLWSFLDRDNGGCDTVSDGNNKPVLGSSGEGAFRV